MRRYQLVATVWGVVAAGVLAGGCDADDGGGDDALAGGDTAIVGDTGTGTHAGSGADTQGGGGTATAPDTGTGVDTGTGSPVDTGTGVDTDTGGPTEPPVTCTQADKQVCSTSEIGTHCGLTYEMWTDSTAGCMVNTATGFSATWNEGNGDYLARKGVRPGPANPVVTYSADYNPNGNSYLAVYGWTQNPLIEYYIVESWGSWRPPGTDSIGTITVDGGTYDVYRSQRVNQPSIEGNTTFWQYWSVRRDKRTSGTISVGDHFAAWESYGLQLGTFYEVSMVVEGYHSSGTATVSLTIQ